MKLYNSLTRKKEELIPIEDRKIHFYSCGQTIYLDMHIGNARTFSYWDVMVRYLRWRGYDVFWVQNITDVGHLTSDEDTGEDKIVKTAREKRIQPIIFVETQIKRFFEDIDALNIQRADIYPRATCHIPEMIEFVNNLLEKGYAYEKNGSVYFDITKFPSYGELSPVTHTEESAGTRVTINPEKKNLRDFALWIKAPENYLMFWTSPWGLGYPGWHLECSVMSQKYLGETIDIHAGGIEHLMLHHPNEIAQSEARTGKKFVNYWLHANHLTVNDRKMSKSLGNSILVRDLLQKHDPMAIRLFLVNSHYRKNVDYNDRIIRQSYELLKRIRNSLMLIDQTKGGTKATLMNDITILEKEFIEAMDDDLDTVSAINSIMKFIRKVNYSIDNRVEILKLAKFKILELMNILGIWTENTIFRKNENNITNSLIDILLTIRTDLRAEGNYELADKIRTSLFNLSILIEDKKEGTIWRFDRY